MHRPGYKSCCSKYWTHAFHKGESGRNASFCCQSGLQSGQPSHSLAQLVSESSPSLFDLCLALPLNIFQFSLWWKKAVLFLPCTWDMTSLPGLWVLDLGNFTNFIFLGCSFALVPEDQDCCELWHNVELTGLETVWLQVLPQRPANCRIPCPTVLWERVKPPALSHCFKDTSHGNPRSWVRGPHMAF